MIKTACLVLACLLAACASVPTQSSSGCIRGDPSGPPACQAATYSIAR